MKSIRWLAVVAAVLATGACTGTHSRGPAAGASPRASQPLVLDDGSLTITPARGTPGIQQALAARILAGQELAVADGRLPARLASVSASLPASPGSAGASADLVQRLHLPLAWVYVGYQHPRFTACSGPLPPPAPSHRVAKPSYAWVVIVDAQSGAGYEYVGARAGFCRPATQPTLRRARLGFSIPFTDTKLGPLLVRQTFRVPACGSFESFGGSRVNIAVASVPTAPCAGTPTTRVSTLRARIIERPHARLGLVCWGVYDATLGPPADCVSPD